MRLELPGIRAISFVLAERTFFWDSEPAAPSPREEEDRVRCEGSSCEETFPAGSEILPER